ncbi:MAG: hypothetical protein ACI9CA_000753 [Natronomonas sp.]
MHSNQYERPPAGRQSTGSVDTEDVYLRNYDPFCEHDLTVTVTDGSGGPVFRRRYYFQPGEVRSERDLFEPGVYEVTVELDGCRRETATCRVGPEPGRAVHVELGNGAVSVTEGLYG